MLKDIAMLNEVLQELKGEIDRSTLQCIVVDDPKARHMIPPEIVLEALKHLLGEFLIGLSRAGTPPRPGAPASSGGELFAQLGDRRQRSAPPAKAELDVALEEALAAARAHAGTEADLLAASRRVEELMQRAGASPSETRDVVDTIKRVLGKYWTK